MTRRSKKFSLHVEALLACLFALLFTGCVTVYQPLVSLQRPVVLNPQVANFDGLRVQIRCAPAEPVNLGDADLLCRNVRALFTNQGAQVDFDEESATKPDLVIDLKSRLLHEDHSLLLGVVSYLTFTLVPAVSEFTFAQDVTIRDSEGFLLASDSLQARFIRYFGFGIWAVNSGLDLLVRTDSEKVTGDAVKRDFSRDFYGQLSQLAFHARMRSVVLRGFESSAAPGAE